jgi:hypothetical protein
MLLPCHIPHLPVLPSIETQDDADGMLTYADAFRVATCFQAIFARITILPLPLPHTRSNSPYHFMGVLDKLMLRVRENREQENARYLDILEKVENAELFFADSGKCGVAEL